MLSLRRIAFSLLTGILLLLLLTGLSLRAAAEEGVEGFFWIIPQGLEAPDLPREPYFYAPLLSMTHTSVREDGTVSYSGTCCPRVFQLILPGKSGIGEKPYGSAAAYCIDAAMDIRDNARYRLGNLEDSGCFDEETAGKIRAVLVQSFPQKNVRAIQARANVWLRRHGLPQIQDLQSAEAILAAQAAIWKLTGKDQYLIQALYSGTMEPTAADLWAMLDKTAVDEPSLCAETAFTASNVESLFSYLCNLPPEGGRNALVSVGTFRETVFTSQREENGTLTVTARVMVEWEPDFRDRLTIVASCGDQFRQQELTQTGEYIFTFSGLPDGASVTAEISGEQYANDVYLFAPEYADSQPMAGFYSGMVPVQCRMVITEEETK